MRILIEGPYFHVSFQINTLDLPRTLSTFGVSADQVSVGNIYYDFYTLVCYRFYTSVELWSTRYDLFCNAIFLILERIHIFYL